MSRWWARGTGSSPPQAYRQAGLGTIHKGSWFLAPVCARKTVTLLPGRLPSSAGPTRHGRCMISMFYSHAERRRSANYKASAHHARMPVHSICPPIGALDQHLGDNGLLHALCPQHPLHQRLEHSPAACLPVPLPLGQSKAFNV